MPESSDITVHMQCGNPVVYTMEWRYYEWYCLHCKTHFELYDDDLADVGWTPGLEARAADTRARYLEDKKRRKYDGTR